MSAHGASQRNLDLDARAAERRPVAGSDRASNGVGQRGDDGQPESCAASRAGACTVAASEAIEGLLQQLRREARPVVGDHQQRQTRRHEPW